MDSTFVELRLPRIATLRPEVLKVYVGDDTIFYIVDFFNGMDISNELLVVFYRVIH